MAAVVVEKVAPVAVATPSPFVAVVEETTIVVATPKTPIRLHIAEEALCESCQ